MEVESKERKMKEGGRTTEKAGERSVALISNVARRFEFVRRLVCLILMSERVSVESFTDTQARLNCGGKRGELLKLRLDQTEGEKMDKEKWRRRVKGKR